MKSLKQCNIEVEKKIDKIENIMEGRVLFGAIGGSYALGLQNNSSDIDVFVMLDNVNFSGFRKEHFEIEENGIKIDCTGVNYRQALVDINRYVLLPKEYPTKLHYSEKEIQENVGKRDYERPDFVRSLLYRIGLSDEILMKERMQREYENYGKLMKIIDIIDYHFSCLLGNYMECIFEKNNVNIRKYLYCVHQILTCRWLMNYKDRPSMDFERLLKRSLIDEEVKNVVDQIYVINKMTMGKKEKVEIEKENILNQFIYAQINVIQEYVEKNSIMQDVLPIHK